MHNLPQHMGAVMFVQTAHAASATAAGAVPTNAAAGAAQNTLPSVPAAASTETTAVLSAENEAQTAAKATPATVANVDPLRIPQADTSFSWGGYFSALAGMFFLLGMLWFALRFMKNRGGLRFFGSTENLQVEGRYPLGPKKHLLVVRFMDKRLLIGVTDHHISYLTEADATEFADGEAVEGAYPAAPQDAARGNSHASSTFQKLLAVASRANRAGR